MPLYFLRHGESQANVQGLFAGQQNDSPLTDKGRDQARLAAEELKDKKIDLIISSPLSRAKETAEIVAELLGFELSTIQVEQRLTEYNMGALSGTPIHAVTSQELTSAEGAEDPAVYRDRILSFLRGYKDRPENILIVTHGGIGRAIEAARQGLDAAEFYSLPVPGNAHPTLLDLSWL